MTRINQVLAIHPSGATVTYNLELDCWKFVDATPEQPPKFLSDVIASIF